MHRLQKSQSRFRMKNTYQIPSRTGFPEAPLQYQIQYGSIWVHCTVNNRKSETKKVWIAFALRISTLTVKTWISVPKWTTFRWTGSTEAFCLTDSARTHTRPHLCLPKIHDEKGKERSPGSGSTPWRSEQLRVSVSCLQKRFSGLPEKNSSLVATGWSIPLQISILVRVRREREPDEAERDENLPVLRTPASRASLGRDSSSLFSLRPSAFVTPSFFFGRVSFSFSGFPCAPPSLAVLSSFSRSGYHFRHTRFSFSL